MTQFVIYVPREKLGYMCSVSYITLMAPKKINPAPLTDATSSQVLYTIVRGRGVGRKDNSSCLFVQKFAEPLQYIVVSLLAMPEVGHVAHQKVGMLAEDRSEHPIDVAPN